jgi:hypothetical protein
MFVLEFRAVNFQPEHSSNARALSPLLLIFRDFHIGCCLGNAFEIFHDIEAHALASLDHLRVAAVNGAEAKRYIVTFFASDESGTYLLIEPFYFPVGIDFIFPSFTILIII